MHAKNFSFVETLEKKYEHNPVVCFYCGKPLTFKKYYKQLEKPKRFCCKKCEKNYLLEMPNELDKCNEFSSQTERTIYSYFSLQYPIAIISHNVKDVYPPYEIDFAIKLDNKVIFIEFNGSLHCTKKNKDSDNRVINKHQLNDKIKKNLICCTNKQILIRLWSEIGLYSAPKTFEKALTELKDTIDNTFEFHCCKDYGYCVELIVDKNHDLHKIVEKF